MKEQAKPARRTPKGANPVANGTPSPSADATRESKRISSSGASQQLDGSRFLFDNCPIPAWVCNPKTLSFLAVNEAAQEKYGYSRDEFLAMTLKDLLPPEEISRLQGGKKRKRPIVQFSGLWHHSLKDGTTIEVEIISQIIEYEGRQAILMVAQNMTERKWVEDALRLSEEKYRALVENINDVHFALDTQGLFTYISPAIERFAGYQADEIIGQPFVHYVHPDDLPLLLASFERTLTGKLEPFEFRVLDKNSKVHYVRTSSRPLWQGGQLAGLTGVMVDLTENKWAEDTLQKAHAELERRVEERTAELAKTNRMLKILSECNQTVVRAADEDHLLQQICHKIVDLGGYPLAWIGFAEQDSARTVRPVAQAGFEDDYLNKVNITWADTERGRGPTGTAIRSGQPCIVGNIQTDPNFAPWREDAIQRGYASSIALPLWDDGRVFGALNIYAAVPDAFHEEEVRLLMELSSDLAYGILSLRARAARLRAEKALRTSEARYRNLIETQTEVIARSDLNGHLTFVNDAYCRTFGKTREEFLGQSFIPTVIPEDVSISMTVLESIKSPPYRVQSETRHMTPQGIRWFEWDNAAILDETGHILEFQGIGRDVTERKQAEEALRESQERYRSLYEDNPSMYFTVDPAGTVLSVNKFGYEQLGYTAQELIGQSVLKVFHEEDKDTAASSVALCVQNPGQMFHWELRKVHQTGRVMWVKETARAIQEQDGRIVVFIVCEDITDRKQADEALRESEELYRLLTDSSTDLIGVTDFQGKVIFVSPSVRQMMGSDPDQVIGTNAFSTIHPEDAPASREAWARALAGETVTFMHRAQHADGTWRWLDGWGKVVQFQGQPRVIIVSRDITDRKRAEVALRESEERYRRLIELSPDGIFVHSEGRVVYVNTAAVKLLGGETSDDLIGKAALDFVHPSDRASVIERIRRINIEGQQAPLAEEKFMRLDGTPVDVEVAAIPFTFRGKPAVQGVMRDIAQRKRAEEKLRRHLAELEAVSRISAALRTAQTRDEALPVLLDATLAAFETEAGNIRLYYPEHDELRAVVNRGWFQQLSETPMKPGEGIAGKVFSSGEAHVSEEFAQDPLARPTARPQIPPGWGGACVPIRTGSLTVGVLFVSVPLPRQLDNEQVSLLISLAEIAGAALHRMSLHEETVYRLDQLQALHLIDRAITASMDLHMTLDILLEQVTSQLEVDATDVLLYNPNTLTLEYAAGRGFRTHTRENARLRLGENFAGRVALEHRAVQLEHPEQIQEIPQFAALWASEEFEAYYAVPLIAKGQIKGVLELFHRAPLIAGRDWVNFLETLAGQAAIAIENTQLFQHLQRSNADLALAYDATIEGWSKALDLRDKETEGHTLRVTEMTLQLARAAGITDEELVHVRRGALLHDIGKMGVPDAILFKPDQLTEEEWAIMHKHPTYAYEMLWPIIYLRPALDIPYCHHEKWDGSGYPRELKGEQIPLAARLFAVIDTYDALSSDRLYRTAWSHEKTLEHIESLAGTHFDPQVVRLFLKEMKGKRLGNR